MQVYYTPAVLDYGGGAAQVSLAAGVGVEGAASTLSSRLRSVVASVSLVSAVSRWVSAGLTAISAATGAVAGLRGLMREVSGGLAATASLAVAMGVVLRELVAGMAVAVLGVRQIHQVSAALSSCESAAHRGVAKVAAVVSDLQVAVSRRLGRIGLTVTSVAAARDRVIGYSRNAVAPCLGVVAGSKRVLASLIGVSLSQASVSRSAWRSLRSTVDVSPIAHRGLALMRAAALHLEAQIGRGASATLAVGVAAAARVRRGFFRLRAVASSVGADGLRKIAVGRVALGRLTGSLARSANLSQVLVGAVAAVGRVSGVLNRVLAVAVGAVAARMLSLRRVVRRRVGAVASRRRFVRLARAAQTRVLSRAIKGFRQVLAAVAVMAPTIVWASVGMSNLLMRYVIRPAVFWRRRSVTPSVQGESRVRPAVTGKGRVRDE